MGAIGYERLRQEVWEANRRLAASGLIVLTYGNVSGIDRQAGVFAIKPSGFDYETLRPEHIVVLSLESGDVVDGDLRPSADTPTHHELYRAFPSVGGVVHTHSRYATAWAQARRPIPCLGGTHADLIRGGVPVTRLMTADEIDGEYERNTGHVIVERFSGTGPDPEESPAVLVAGHGPFAWGHTAAEALANAIALEEIAAIATHQASLGPLEPMPEHLRERHYTRKHGPGAYYGQPAEPMASHP